MTRRARIALLAGVVLLGAASTARAETPEGTFDAACRAYEQGDWDAAADGFRSLLRYGLADWRLEYNLANTEYKRGRLGEAILHYERARRLAPADPDIVRSKTIANGLTRKVAKGDVIVVPPGTPHWFNAIDGTITYLESRVRVK